jgi:hypothetical protein
MLPFMSFFTTAKAVDPRRSVVNCGINGVTEEGY